MYLHSSAELTTPMATGSFDRPSQEERLTTQEIRIINLMAVGLVPKDVARATTTQVSTVRSHLKNIRRKLDVHSNIRALHVARQRGLLTNV
jgi:DNA-binding NarL/FixJ family response regulator